MNITKFELKQKAQKFVKDYHYNPLTHRTLWEFIDYLYGNPNITGMFDLEDKDDITDIEFCIKQLQDTLTYARH